MKKELIKKYAKLLIKYGVNLQIGQGLLIKCPVSSIDLTREVVKCAYEAGCSNVLIDYSDDEIRKTILSNSKETDLYIKDFELLKAHYLVDNNYARLTITSPSIDTMKDIDMSIVHKANKHNSKLTKFLSDHVMNNHVQWCVCAYPNKEWAKKVFPEYCEKDAFDALFDKIMEASHVSLDKDPLVEWDNLNKELIRRNELLNNYDFKELVFTNSLGTNISIGLVDGHIWAGGGEYSKQNVYFNPNIPTEENFTMPHNKKINGIVYATKPLDINGVLVEDFYFKFKDGKVIEFDALKGKSELEKLLSFDEGSSSLGEVAIVPYYSPISLSNILFYNTLFDENASCHLALGQSYVSSNLKDGDKYSMDELNDLGCNQSNIHEDFMFGSKCMVIKGITKDNQEIIFYKDGKFI